jgi:hypothetical protein
LSPAGLASIRLRAVSSAVPCPCVDAISILIVVVAMSLKPSAGYT